MRLNQTAVLTSFPVPPSFLSLAVCVCKEAGYFCPCASTISILGFVYKIGTTDCVHAEGLAQIVSRSYSTHSVRGSTDHPNMSLARESVYSRPVTGCKSELRARIYMTSHDPNTAW